MSTAFAGRIRGSSPLQHDRGKLLGIVAQSDLGRRMTNRELGQLARETSIRGNRRGGSSLVRAADHAATTV